MLYNKIFLYSYILSLILYNAIGQQLTIKKKKNTKLNFINQNRILKNTTLYQAKIEMQEK